MNTSAEKTTIATVQHGSPEIIFGMGARLADVRDDEQLIDLWLHGKSKNTRDAYRRDINYFLAFIAGKPLQQVTLNDLQSYADALAQKFSASTQRRRLNAVRSLLSYGHNLGVLAVNAGKPVKLPEPKQTMAQRILTEAEVQKLLHCFKGSERDRLLPLVAASLSPGLPGEALKWSIYKHAFENCVIGRVRR